MSLLRKRNLKTSDFPVFITCFLEGINYIISDLNTCIKSFTCINQTDSMILNYIFFCKLFKFPSTIYSIPFLYFILYWYFLILIGVVPSNFYLNNPSFKIHYGNIYFTFLIRYLNNVPNTYIKIYNYTSQRYNYSERSISVRIITPDMLFTSMKMFVIYRKNPTNKIIFFHFVHVRTGHASRCFHTYILHTRQPKVRPHLNLNHSEAVKFYKKSNNLF